MKAKILSLIPFLLLFTTLSGQDDPESTQFFHTRTAVGASSMEGFAALVSYSYEYKKHGFTLRCLQTNQFGNIHPYGLVPSFYNDRFGEASIMYTKSFRKKMLYASASAGPAVCKYVDRELVKEIGGMPSDAYTRTKETTWRTGIAAEANFFIHFTENFGIGIICFGNLNYSKPITGAAISLSFGFLKD